MGVRRVPRTRGDGPGYPKDGRASRPCSPHTRGWTGSEHRGAVRIHGVPRTRGDGPRSLLAKLETTAVFPAHAGMDRAIRCVPSHCSRVPRTRGDGPDCVLLRAMASGVFPAHAGMDRSCQTVSARQVSCSPHTRGWTGASQGPNRLGDRVPRTRGDGPCPSRAPVRGLCVFPAHAGMDRHAEERTDLEQKCSPHTRGWTVPDPRARNGRQQCSPHTRGWTDRTLFTTVQPSVFPAHAGMDRGRAST